MTLRSVTRPVLLSFILGCLCCYAAPPQAAASPQEELENTQKSMEEAQQRKDQLSEQADKVQQELKALQEKLVKTADTLQKTEAELTDTENKLKILTDELEAKKAALKLQQQHLAALVMAELTLSKTPPEAVLMMPGDPMDVLKAARALNMASGSIRQESQALSLQMDELSKLMEKVSQRRDQLAKLQASLDKQRKELVKQVAERNALQNRLGREEKQTDATLARLAHKAAGLRDLITGLAREEVRQQAEAEASHHRPSDFGRAIFGHTRSFAAARGRIRAPVAGTVVTPFGKSEGRNATSKGITIMTRPGAQVTAPYDGEVVFTGPFLNYGQMIILHHSDDFHTLLAGLAKIDVRTGQFLLEGEPIGAMGEGSESKNGHKLYIELRNENQPVDPALWINGLTRNRQH